MSKALRVPDYLEHILYDTVDLEIAWKTIQAALQARVQAVLANMPHTPSA